MKISVFWFRRDLRLEDNTALKYALDVGLPVLPIFIFDDNILGELSEDDPRVGFIYESLQLVHIKLVTRNSSLLCLKGKPLQVWEDLLSKYEVAQVFANRDYEPYARERDQNIGELLTKRGVSFHLFKDQVIFEQDEILKDDGKPYTIFTPYKNKWLQRFQGISNNSVSENPTEQWIRTQYQFPDLSELGFQQSSIRVKPFDLSQLNRYEAERNIPSKETTNLGPHLRFGTVSIRWIVSRVNAGEETFLSELIWREFFMQILYHYPHVVSQNFKPQYNRIAWRNNEKEFERWYRGETGYPLVDAGMRQLNETGYMHNRVRMVVASFLCKHLLIDWRWGEAYFAKKLLDYELSSNNGNWQWAAGTGCDAAPYFRVFNPTEQARKFDDELTYIKRWVPEYSNFGYPEPMVDHKLASKRAIEVYKKALQ